MNRLPTGIAETLREIRKKGVRLWSTDGELHYKAPRGALSCEDIERLKAASAQIVAFLERNSGSGAAEPRLMAHRHIDRIPLTFTQFKYWHWDRLYERPTIRSVASATRVRGRLDVVLLQESIVEIVGRHEALRTRIVTVDGSPTQEIAQSCDSELAVDDLRALPEDARAAEVERMIHELILGPIYVATGPLFAIRLARLRDDEYVLIVAMEHIIADAFSRNILLRDLFTTYWQRSKGRMPSLPAIPLQLADYAVWQKNSHESWMEQHGAYWNDHLAGCGRLRFRQDPCLTSERRSKLGTVPFLIGRELTAELREWCRLRQTTMVMGAFTVFAALALRWGDAADAVVRYQADGRSSALLENVIGYLSSTLNLRMKLLGNDTFLDLLNRSTEEYCRAVEHFDFSYVDAQVPRREFTRNPAFNWVPHEPRDTFPAATDSADAIALSPIRFAYPMLDDDEYDYEPAIVLYDKENEIEGAVGFSPRQFSAQTMERFRDNFIMFIEQFIRRPQRRVQDILLR